MDILITSTLLKNGNISSQNLSNMKIAEIRALLTGKKISYYDSFNGTGGCFVIGHVENLKTSVIAREVKNKGFGIFIPKDIINPLLTEGMYMNIIEIERCRVTQTWKIID